MQNSWSKRRPPLLKTTENQSALNVLQKWVYHDPRAVRSWYHVVVKDAQGNLLSAKRAHDAKQQRRPDMIARRVESMHQSWISCPMWRRGNEFKAT